MNHEDLDIDGILELGHEARSRRQALVELTDHARMRCIERHISHEACIEAFRQGTIQEADNGRWMCIREGCVVIVDETFSKVLTAWNLPSHGIHLKKVPITAEMEQAHATALKRAKVKSVWTSHTVAIVDQSGSMRKVDIDKYTMRSDIVWLNLAVTVVAKGILSGERKDTDMLSVVSMRNESEVLIQHEPFDWILYNKLVDSLASSLPGSGGCYQPALETASVLLNTCRSRRCALQLIFLSDGRPSDRMRRGDFGTWEARMIRYVKEFIAALASPLGKRLAVCLIGIGSSDPSEFQVMSAMKDEVEQFECPVVFESCCISATQLATALTTTASSTTATKTQLESLEDGNLRPYIKQRLSEVGLAQSPTETWTVVKQQLVICPKRNKFHRRIVRTQWIEQDGWVAYSGNETFLDCRAVGVAFENRWFGQGSERLAKEFCEIDENERFVGPRWVAKASLKIQTQDSRSGTETKRFNKKFFRTHLLASKAANMLNEILSDKGYIDLPKLEFLKCHIYMLEFEDNTREGYLIEPMLNIKKYPYQKFNDNTGSVFDSFVGRARLRVDLKSAHYSTSVGVLETIHEEEEEEEACMMGENEETLHYNNVTVLDLLQTFSCFSYHFFGKKKLVCDLQGVYNEEKNVLQLTDPVVHQRNSKHYQNTNFGRTDRGDAGIDDFKKTHKCSHFCKLVRAALWEKRQRDTCFVSRSFDRDNFEEKAIAGTKSSRKQSQ